MINNTVQTPIIEKKSLNKLNSIRDKKNQNTINDDRENKLKQANNKTLNHQNDLIQSNNSNNNTNNSKSNYLENK